MLPSERLAIAARVHVLLRRKTGRVTDTEWMAANAEYATEIVRYARERATEPGFEDVLEWVARLEQAVVAAPVTARRKAFSPTQTQPVMVVPERSSGFHNTAWADSGFGETRLPSAPASSTDETRYIGRLR